MLVNPRPRTLKVSVTGFDLNHARNLLTNRVLRGESVTLTPHAAMVLVRR